MTDDIAAVDAVMEAIRANADASRQYAQRTDDGSVNPGSAAHHAEAVKNLAEALHALNIGLNAAAIN
jgi:hypothetical protein